MIWAFTNTQRVMHYHLKLQSSNCLFQMSKYWWTNWSKESSSPHIIINLPDHHTGSTIHLWSNLDVSGQSGRLSARLPLRWSSGWLSDRIRWTGPAGKETFLFSFLLFSFFCFSFFTPSGLMKHICAVSHKWPKQAFFYILMFNVSKSESTGMSIWLSDGYIPLSCKDFRVLISCCWLTVTLSWLSGSRAVVNVISNTCGFLTTTC